MWENSSRIGVRRFRPGDLPPASCVPCSHTTPRHLPLLVYREGTIARAQEQHAVTHCPQGHIRCRACCSCLRCNGTYSSGSNDSRVWGRTSWSTATPEVKLPKGQGQAFPDLEDDVKTQQDGREQPERHRTDSPSLQPCRNLDPGLLDSETVTQSMSVV